MEERNGAFTIAHISDIHCGGPDFVPNLMERAIIEINELKPNLVICSGDLTTFGSPEQITRFGLSSLISMIARSIRFGTKSGPPQWMSEMCAIVNAPLGSCMGVKV